jgi:hypothetical protein
LRRLKRHLRFALGQESLLARALKQEMPADEHGDRQDDGQDQIAVIRHQALKL